MAKLRRDAQMYEFQGTQRTVAEIARIVKLDYGLLYSRLSRGMPLEQATSQPKRRRLGERW